MNIDSFDNTDHTSEEQLQVYYYSFQDDDLEPELLKPQNPLTFNTLSSLHKRFRNAHKKEDTKTLHFVSPLDYLRKEMQNKVDNILTFRQIQIFANPSLLRTFGKPRALLHHQDLLYLGGSLGHILLLDKQAEVLQSATKHGPVSVLEAAANNLLVGHENGAITLFYKNKFIESFPNIHTAKIIALQVLFQSQKDKKFSTISSDISGRVRISHFQKSMFGFDYTPQLAVPKQAYPILTIVVLSKAQSRYYVPNDHKFRVVLLCSLQKLSVLQIYKNRDSKLRSLLEIENPHFTSPEKPFCATVSVGQAQLMHGNAPQQLILLSWNSHFYIVCRQETKFVASKPLMMNKQMIHFSQLIGDSTVQVVTQSQTVYFFSTKDLDIFRRPISINQIAHQFQKKSWSDFLLTSLYSVEERDQEGEVKERQYPLWLQAYGYSANQLFMLTEQSVIHGTINNFDQSVDQFIQNKEPSKAMFLVLSLIDGSIKFSPIKYNQETLNRKVIDISTNFIKLVLDKAKEIIDKYQTIKYTPSMDPLHRLDINNLRTFLSLLIDFLLRTSCKVLFNQIYSILKKFFKNDISLFCDELLIFVLNNRLVPFEASSDTIIEIIEYYNSVKQFQCIELLIQNLEVSANDSEEIISVCLKLKLTKPLGFICAKSGDFLIPLAKLWGIIQNELKKDPINFPNVIEQGQSILLYLESTLTHEKFLKETQDQISVWLFEEQTLLQLACIDLIQTFQLIYEFFLKNYLPADRLIKYCQNVLRTLEKVQLGKKAAQKRDPALQQLIQLQVGKLNKINWDKLIVQLECTYQALMVLNNHVPIPQPARYQQLLMDLLGETHHLVYLPFAALSLPQILNDDENTLQHCLVFAYNHIIIEFVKKVGHNFDQEAIVNKASIGNFEYFLIYLAERDNNYIRALDLRVKVNKTIKDLSLVLPQDLFDWIRMILQKEIVVPNFDRFKDRVLHHISSLVSFGTVQCRAIIQRFFSDSDLAIVEQLGAYPNLQLEYIEHILSVDRSTFQSNTELLKLYIKLLCQLKPHAVLQELKSNDYPLDDIIVVCKQYPVADALAHLLERSGAISEAIRILLEDFAQKVKKRDFQNKLHYVRYLEGVFQICIRNSQTYYPADMLEGCEDELDHYDQGWDLVAQRLVTLASDPLVPLPFSSYLNESVAILFMRWSENSHLRIFLGKILMKYMKLSSVKLQKTFLNLYAHLHFKETVFQKLYDIAEVKSKEFYFRLMRVQHRGQAFFAGCYRCMTPIMEQEQRKTLCVLACGHMFHYKCMNLGLKSFHQCPLCTDNKRFYIIQLVEQLQLKKMKVLETQQRTTKEYHSVISKIMEEAERKQKQIEKELEEEGRNSKSASRNELFRKWRNLESANQQKITLQMQDIRYQ